MLLTRTFSEQESIGSPEPLSPRRVTTPLHTLPHSALELRSTRTFALFDLVHQRRSP